MKKYQGLIVLSTAVLLAACGNTADNNENNAGNAENNTEVTENNNAEVNEEETNEAADETNEEMENNEGDNENNESNTEENAGNEEVDAGEYPITVTDHAGNEVTIEEEPESIVTMQPSDTEILFELGAGDRIVGVSDFANYPEEALEIEQVGGQDMDAEMILSLEPDLALVSDYHHNNHGEILDQYRDAGIEVFVIENPASFDGAFEHIEMLGEITGTEEQAEEIVSGMQAELDELREQSEEIDEEDRKTVWIEVAPSPDIFTTGQGTFMHEMLEVIGAENAAADHEGWVNLTEEEIVTLEPDTIITTYGFYVDDPVAEVTEREGWSDVPAVENEDIHDVDSDMVSRSGPRLVDGTRLIAEAVYPDVFQ
ncbi:ABC transporter substrate-binding protein [Alkalicoccus daliensis]|uniref:Iron complex transport system substrate-binding protein n=1 Tax=Alkalicoccus daliensis TaxID=745820 RepID=A0A1H0HY95_9BACI|nr:ABC transporter substrate-binding protein [Alkalicoccus daliensis]SDO24226.1 iron complex transport system substrate-binding protein [Alkalicoccus daliensis]